MILHVLPGDAYTEAFSGTGLEGDVAIFREALVEGDLWGPSLPEFWKTRENYHAENDPQNHKPYQSYVADEIEKLLQPGAGDEIDLWFEYELFCSVNYWFCLYLLRDSFTTIYRVSPTVRTAETRWLGFGDLNSDQLIKCWEERVALTADDVELGTELWHAFKTENQPRLKKLGAKESPAFPYLREVTEAAVEIETLPKQILTEISSGGETDFKKVFTEFRKRAGVYGFGDSQVKKIIDS
jgi:hypothetical protein